MLNAHLWQPIQLTLKLATSTTLCLLLIGTPIAWWLAHTRSLSEAIVSTIVAIPLVLPPTVFGFYLLIAWGPKGLGGWVGDWVGVRTFAFTFGGLVFGSIIYSMPFVVQPLRNSFEAMGRRPLEVAATLRASPLDCFITLVLPFARPCVLMAQ